MFNENLDQHLTAARHLHLTEDILEMFFDRVRTDAHHIGDLLIAHTLHDCARHLHLAGGQTVLLQDDFNAIGQIIAEPVGCIKNDIVVAGKAAGRIDICLRADF